MAILRLLLIVFNVVVVTYLVFRMFQVAKEPIPKGKKAVILIAGILLLLAPFSMFLSIINPSFTYFMIYPVAISLFLYLIYEVKPKP
ncbi:MAG: hypothetical protein KF845_13890 [Cyclobacteriaceae bacterium]|nr:hypothetical protein [Cyclobacteriaceae bacterium]